VVVVLNCADDKIPDELEALVRAGVEAGAALAGTVQTENIGFEKIICNVIANPNIRYAVLTGPESDGHSTSEAFKALINNGVDDQKRIIGTGAPHPLLFNIPMDYIQRFRDQITLLTCNSAEVLNSSARLSGRATRRNRWSSGVRRSTTSAPIPSHP
jgi:tetrahydromethanopterin S-methyltransferase subunit A